MKLWIIIIIFFLIHSTTTSSSTPTTSSSKQNTTSYSPIITGCRITEYLLEKSRIVTHNDQERNYHVFYELLRGLSKEQKEKYGLLSAEKYFYLNQGGNCTIPGKHDAEDFQALLSAMQILGFNNEEINNIFKILASVLHLGNVYFHRKNLKHGVEGVEIGSDVEVQFRFHGTDRLHTAFLFWPYYFFLVLRWYLLVKSIFELTGTVNQ